MQKTIATLILLLLFASPAFSQQDGYTGSRTNQPVFMKMQPKAATTPEQIKCMRRVLMNLNGKLFEVSRTKAMDYTTTDGKTITSDMPNHPANDCNIVDVGAVQRFSTGFRNWSDIDIEVSVPDKESIVPLKTTYSSNRDVIDDAIKQDTSTVSQDGVRTILWNNVVLYVLPKGVLPTGNREPVAVYCMAYKDDEDSSICNSRYIHPDGFSFKYSYLEKKKRRADHLGLDVVARKRFEEMKSKMQAVNAVPAAPKPAVPNTLSPANPVPANLAPAKN